MSDKSPLWPVYEFRPSARWLSDWALPFKPTEMFRYNGGAWIPDDGEYDLAFALPSGPPLCLCVSLPHSRNIIWSWLDGSWRADGLLSHPIYRGSSGPNPWHYMLRPGATSSAPRWARGSHENTVAGDKGMSWLSSRRGCANGRQVEFNPKDQHIREGLMRRRDTKEVVTIPDPLVCMYCDAPPPTVGQAGSGGAERAPSRRQHPGVSALGEGTPHDR